MLIGGLEKLTLIDYPGKIAAIVFTQGCNLRCHFCYNPMLVAPHTSEGSAKQKNHLITEDDFFAFLKSRINKLDGVVISGGEPTLQADLEKFILKIKNLGFLVKLDTNGANPEILESLIKQKLIDYIAMDVKAPPDKYLEIVNADPRGLRRGQASGVCLPKIKKSIKIIMNSGLPYEFRTTVVPGLIFKKDIAKMGKMIKGASKWYLQNFKSDTDLINKTLEKEKSYSEIEMREMAQIGKKYAKICAAR